MNKILVTGNGFDLNLGLKTSYQDFLESDIFKKVSRTDPGHPEIVSTYLRSIQAEKNWVDIEDELKNFVFGLMDINKGVTDSPAYEKAPNLFKDLSKNPEYITHYIGHTQDNYNYIKRTLTDYLNSLFPNRLSLPNQASAAILLKEGALTKQLANSPHRDFDKVYTFNYTPTAQRLLSNIPVTYLHGSLRDNNIVFGVEDTAKLPDGFEYLYKSSSPAYSKDSQGLAAEMNDCNEIHFFGVSFGYTDDSHFKPLFKQLLTVQHIVKVYFYVCGGSRNYYSLVKRLRELTEYKFDLFKQKHQPVFIDVENRQIINDEWLRIHR